MSQSIILLLLCVLQICGYRLHLYRIGILVKIINVGKVLGQSKIVTDALYAFSSANHYF